MVLQEKECTVEIYDRTRRKLWLRWDPVGLTSPNVIHLMAYIIELYFNRHCQCWTHKDLCFTNGGMKQLNNTLADILRTYVGVERDTCRQTFSGATLQ